jgi:hypothetical protein
MNRDSHKSPSGREGRTGTPTIHGAEDAILRHRDKRGLVWLRQFGLDQDLSATLDGLVDSLFIASNSAGATKREINWWLGFG